MKNLILLLLFTHSVGSICMMQEPKEKLMEKRAREMHRVIGLDDKEQWKNFIQENYTQRLIDKPIQARVQTLDNGNSSSGSSEIKSANNLEAKAALFERLHNDFGNSEIILLKPTGEKLEMTLRNDRGMNGTFHLTFEKNSPYRIDGLGIEAGN